MRFRSRRMRPVVYAAAGVAAATALLPLAATADPAQSTAQATIVVTPGDGERAISDRIFGANNNYAAGGSGMYDTEAGEVYPSFVEQVKESHFTAMRFPGGTMANLYHFERAIGPQADRTPNTNGVLSDPEPLDNDFGPDEYGRFLEQTGMKGNLVLNFATGTPAEAADFVEYMTARVGTNPNGGVAWAQVRARNGHARPYPIDTFEIGNELADSGQAYWMGGASQTTCANPVNCLYVDGGSTTFTDQAVVGSSDWRAAASQSSGAAGQTFYARYAPVSSGTDVVKVAGTVWQRVDDLTAAAPDAHTYSINDSTGAITFGDGTHGAIPAAGAKITVSYTSGPHPGFDAYYAAVKSADPSGKVCSSVDTPAFVQRMGSTHPYDCIVRHAYSNGPASALSADDYHDQLMAIPPQLGASLETLQDNIKQYAGDRASKITTVVTEYGELGSGAPVGSTHYRLSLDLALYVTDLLQQWARLGVPLAEKAKLTDYVWSPAPPATQSVGFPENAMIAGPGPDSVRTPTAQVIGEIEPAIGRTYVPSTVEDNPTRTTSANASLPALSVLASRTGKQYSLIVVNQDRSQDVTAATRAPVHGRALVCTVDGPSYLSYNSQTDPNVVAESCSWVLPGHPITYPAHSVTTVQYDEHSSADGGGAHRPR